MAGNILHGSIVTNKHFNNNRTNNPRCIYLVQSCFHFSRGMKLENNTYGALFVLSGSMESWKTKAKFLPPTAYAYIWKLFIQEMMKQYFLNISHHHSKHWILRQTNIFSTFGSYGLSNYLQISTYKKFVDKWPNTSPERY